MGSGTNLPCKSLKLLENYQSITVLLTNKRRHLWLDALVNSDKNGHVRQIVNQLKARNFQSLGKFLNDYRRLDVNGFDARITSKFVASLWAKIWSKFDPVLDTVPKQGPFPVIRVESCPVAGIYFGGP
jgi:hypothetical protein